MCVSVSHWRRPTSIGIHLYINLVYPTGTYLTQIVSYEQTLGNTDERERERDGLLDVLTFLGCRVKTLLLALKLHDSTQSSLR